VGSVIDAKSRPTFVSGSWFVLFVDFKSAFDKVNHSILFEKLEGSGVKQRTLNILKLLYNSYHFTLPGDRPYKVNTGVAQGSLVSPLLYNWYINNLIAELSNRVGQDRTFAYADDLAVLCLGYSEVRLALSIVQEWAAENGAEVNKKKCGILRITKRETPISKKTIEGVDFVQKYRYLGVPLDQSLCLKHVLSLVKKRVTAFCSRISLVLQSIVGLRIKLGLWQTFARCHFEYFAPVLVLSGQLKKFESLYMKSLKKALDLPLQIQNEKLLSILGLPSLTQMAAHHVVRCMQLIEDRFTGFPKALYSLTESLNSAAKDYMNLQARPTVSADSEGTYILDLATCRTYLNKSLVGLATGSFLTIRSGNDGAGPSGRIRECPRCKSSATQEHFLNFCSVNSSPREILLRSLPSNFSIQYLSDRNFNSFYMNIRQLRVEVAEPVNHDDPISAPVISNLARAAACVAQLLVANSLALFD